MSAGPNNVTIIWRENIFRFDISLMIISFCNVFIIILFFILSLQLRTYVSTDSMQDESVVSKGLLPLPPFKIKPRLE